jgi:hypothetical protein
MTGFESQENQMLRIIMQVHKRMEPELVTYGSRMTGK